MHLVLVLKLRHNHLLSGDKSGQCLLKTRVMRFLSWEQLCFQKTVPNNKSGLSCFAHIFSICYTYEGKNVK